MLPDGSIKSHHGVNRKTGKNIEELRPFAKIPRTEGLEGMRY
jgi:hypothetical protein